MNWKIGVIKGCKAGYLALNAISGKKKWGRSSSRRKNHANKKKEYCGLEAPHFMCSRGGMKGKKYEDKGTAGLSYVHDSAGEFNLIRVLQKTMIG